MERIWIDAVEFKDYGQWKVETQFVREMAQPYLVAAHVPGQAVEDAETTFKVNEAGYYRFFVRTKNWKYPEAPGQFTLKADGTELANVCGKMPVLYWYWEIAGDLYLEAGEHKLSLCDKTGWLSRCAAIVITNDMDFVPSPENQVLLKQRASMKHINTKPIELGEWDYIVVGAGPGGVPAAISAARKGLKTALICGRPHIGGNASDEGTIGFDGSGAKHPGNHETGIANEIKRAREHFGISWQGALEYLISQEPNITLFENELCIGAETQEDKIISIECVNTMTLEKHIFRADLFADCSGDGWLGYYAGAKYRLGREAKHEFHEEFAPESPDTLTMSGCICDAVVEGKTSIARSFYMEDSEKETEFIAPDWAIKLPEGDALHRTPAKMYGADWWMENSNDFDDLWDSEFARDEMVRLAMGYFDWLKNSYTDREKYKTHVLKQFALHNSKRENRRLIGDYILSQSDYVEGKNFEDTISYTGWGIDIHHVKGIYSGSEGPFHHEKFLIPLSPVPYRCLYSVNIKNLFVASRCSSFSHLALGSTRVESTLATLGQAIGVAAFLCKKYEVMPRDIYEQHVKELQQILLADDQTIPGVQNQDSLDLAKNAVVSASSEDVSAGGYAANVINGKIRPDENGCNAWISAITDGLPQSITLTLPQATVVSRIHITADTDLTYPLFSPWEVPEYGYTAQNLDVEVFDGTEWKTVAEIRDNFRRQMRISMNGLKVEKIRVKVLSTSGVSCAKINEIRVYA